MFLSHVTILIFSIALATGSRRKPSQCPINEHPTDCVNACATPTCSDPRPPDCNFLVCNKGCECNEGYVRTRKPDGPCIPIARCKNCLRPGFEFRECGSTCSTTCRGITEELFCPAVCVPGCYCAGGKVLDEKTNRCVRKSKCSKQIDQPQNCD